MIFFRLKFLAERELWKSAWRIFIIFLTFLCCCLRCDYSLIIHMIDHMISLISINKRKSIVVLIPDSILHVKCFFRPVQSCSRVLPALAMETGINVRILYVRWGRRWGIWWEWWKGGFSSWYRRQCRLKVSIAHSVIKYS